MFGYTWFFLMDRYAKLVGSWSRVYFMSFFIISTIILTIVVSSILEAFSFTMKCKRKLSDIEGEHFFFFPIFLILFFITSDFVFQNSSKTGSKIIFHNLSCLLPLSLSSSLLSSLSFSLSLPLFFPLSLFLSLSLSLLIHFLCFISYQL